MKGIFFALIIEGLISFIFGKNLSVEQKEILIYIYIFIDICIISFVIWSMKINKLIKYILISGFLIRIILLLIDINLGHLPFNDVDANAFHRYGVVTSESLPNEMLEFYNGKYTQFLGMIYYIFGPFRIWGQFINIVFIMGTLLKIVDIFKLLEIEEKYQKIGTIIITFAPIPLMIGQAMLREATMYYCITLSACYFIKSFNKNKILNNSIAIIFVLIAGLYHSGVNILVLVYVYFIIFYDSKKKKIRYGVVHNIAVIAVISIVIIYLSSNGEDIFNTVNMDTGGGSAYLTGAEINNPIEFLLFAPIKAVFLLFSPMPWMIRGGMDLVTFLFDSLLFLAGTVLYIKNKKTRTNIDRGLMLCIIAGALVFGMGSLNAGTAIRHRNKFMVYNIVLIVNILSKKMVKKSENCIIYSNN